MFLIPLGRGASRGDQILNAQSFKKQGFCDVLEEENLTNETLYQAVSSLYRDRESYIQAMKNSNQSNAVSRIVSLIKESCF